MRKERDTVDECMKCEKAHEERKQWWASVSTLNDPYWVSLNYDWQDQITYDHKVGRHN